MTGRPPDRRRFLGLLGATAVASAAGGLRAAAPPVANVLAKGLRFPEAPVALPDGSLLVAEIALGRIVRVAPTGEVTIVARTGGGPNGMAVGPDGALYVCNNGGFAFAERDGLLFAAGKAPDYVGGSIQRVDPGSGKVTTLYDGGPRRLSAPNDLVFDAAGGFWFTDSGARGPDHQDNGALYYALPDGSRIERAVYPLSHPNGVRLSPDGRTLYVALTSWRDLRAFDVVAPGVLGRSAGVLPGRSVASFPGDHLMDSIAVEQGGNICVGSLLADPGITTITPGGRMVGHVALDDPLPTNIAFGGPGHRRAFVTLSGSGRVVQLTWPRAGLPLNFANRFGGGRGS